MMLAMARRVQALSRCAICTAEIATLLAEAKGFMQRLAIKGTVPRAAVTTVNGTAMCAMHASEAQQSPR
jgi:hypothetical protein